ncbi:MAG TPA: hypothetical protein VET85_17415 [Stellaceae bacterium]|nr:hypothetical protein [Stellaceae bacterium]
MALSAASRTEDPKTGSGPSRDAMQVEREATAWNVVITLNEGTYFEARRLLRGWGQPHSTGFYHVLVMRVQDVARFTTEFATAVAEAPGILNVIAHVAPARAAFDFASAGEFETRATEFVGGWIGELAGKRFHVRLHRRGFKGVLSTPREEQFLDTALLSALERAGTPGTIGFDDPDAVIQIETVRGRAGMSLWRRDELRRYAFLGRM